MTIVIVFIKYNRRSNENNVYIDNESVGILIFMSISYIGLFEKLFEVVRLSLENYTMVIKYTFELGCSPLKILNGCDVNFF